MIDTDRFLDPLPTYLVRQRWYSGTTAPTRVTILDERFERDEWPALLCLLVEADGATYQVLLGLRCDERPEFLTGKDDAVLGEFPADDGRLVA